MKKEKFATKFRSLESAEKCLRDHLTVYGTYGDEHNRDYWLVGTHCHTINDKVLFI